MQTDKNALTAITESNKTIKEILTKMFLKVWYTKYSVDYQELGVEKEIYKALITQGYVKGEIGEDGDPLVDLQQDGFEEFYLNKRTANLCKKRLNASLEYYIEEASIEYLDDYVKDIIETHLFSC